MPSQNLPKPNLPGQLQTKPVTAAQPNPPTPPQAPVANQTVFSAPTPSLQPSQPSQPLQSTQLTQAPMPQVVPAGLSRENPGGTPPKMSVVAPAGNLFQASQTGPTSIVAPENAASAKPTTMTAGLPNQLRPASPLQQINLTKAPQTNQAAVTGQATTGMSAPVTAPSAPTTSAVAPQAVVSPTVNSTVTSSAKPATAAPEVAQATTASSTSTSTSTATTTSATSASPTTAKSKFKLPLPALIAGGVVLVALLGFALWSVFKPKATTSSTTKSTTGASTNTSTTGTTTGTGTSGQTTILTYWGLWEDSQILKEVIADFESKNPSIKIDYRKQSHRDYRERLQQAIASGSGPDIFRYHVAWVPMLSADLSPLPSSVMSTTEYKQIFYPTAFNNLQVGGQIVGIPLMYDGLALLYNKEMLRTANLEVPTTWAELRTAATKLTVPANVSERQSGNITRSGLAIGNAGNVDHFSDILALLIVQNGGTPTDPTSQYVKDAVTFYTNFIKQDKIWSERLANSTTAFAKGDVAMIFAPSWRIHDIKNINPELDFGVARLPQLDSEKPITWATFWAEGVSSKSKNKDAAWAFLKYLSSPEVLRKFYTDASQYRAFGEIFPRTDMAAELQNSDLVGAYVTDAPLAKSWYLSSFTHDNGLNDQIIKYYEDAVNAVLTGTNIDKALETAKTGVTSVLTKYSSKQN